MQMVTLLMKKKDQPSSPRLVSSMKICSCRMERMMTMGVMKREIILSHVGVLFSKRLSGNWLFTNPANLLMLPSQKHAVESVEHKWDTRRPGDLVGRKEERPKDEMRKLDECKWN